MKTFLRPLLSLAVLFWIVFSVSAQNLVVNGSFETPAVTNANHWAFFDPTNLWPWQTTATNFEIWTNGFVDDTTGVGPCYSADGGQNLEILSTTNEATVWQTVTTQPGQTYIFAFFYTPRPGFDSVLTVSVDSNVVGTFTENGVGLTNFIWQLFITNLVAASDSTTLSFADLSVKSGERGTHIDGVVLEAPPQLTIELVGDSEVECLWPSVSNQLYQVQYASSLTDTWTNLGAAVLGNGTTNFITDALDPDVPQRFYRLVTVP